MLLLFKLPSLSCIYHIHIDRRFRLRLLIKFTTAFTKRLKHIIYVFEEEKRQANNKHFKDIQIHAVLCTVYTLLHTYLYRAAAVHVRVRTVLYI